MSHRASFEEPSEYGPGIPATTLRYLLLQAVYSLKVLVRVVLFII
jgi:hypothetical protein